ncbi:MAG TPA: DUF481 domain-containing protein [Steroidobacteraceae bacterium]|nr:DUF481 domain-containing protein [Steroidobacteraceae bacterium]
MLSQRTRPFGLLFLSLACVGAALCSSAFAADPPPPEHQWYGSGQGGLLLASGNTESTSANLKIDLARLDGPWKNAIYLGGFYGKSGGITSQERIEGRYQLDHKINDGLFWFGALDGNWDQFSGFAYQATVSTGLGYKFIDTANTKLAGTLGVGYQRMETQQLVKNAAGDVVQRIHGPAENNVVGTAGLTLEQKLTATTKLTDKLLVTSGSANTMVSNDLALAVAMSNRLALSIGYGVRYNTDPASGTKKLDELTTANIVYNIK